MNVTLVDVARAFVGTAEIPGRRHSSQVIAFLQTDDSWPIEDEVAWCSGFVNYCARILEPAALAAGVTIPRSRSLRARSWLKVGQSIELAAARPGWDLVILKQKLEDPGPDVLDVRGHVGLFLARTTIAGVDFVDVLGGNQRNAVNVTRFRIDRILGVRRLLEEAA